VLYTLRLFRAVNTSNGRLSEPQLSTQDAVIQKLGSDKTSETYRGGRRYLVVERRYAIFPQESGNIRIEPVVFEGQIGGASSFPFDPFSGDVRTVRKRYDPIELDAQPIPVSYTNDLWLPARKLELHEVWSEDPPEFRVGEPVTRTIALMAKGLSAAQLPELKLDLPEHFKQYPDQPVLNDQTSKDGLIGIRQEKIAIIPAVAGQYLLPAIQVPWWNTETKRLEGVHLPQRKLTVLPALSVQAATPPSPAAAKNEQPQATQTRATAPVVSRGSSLWVGLALFFALGWAATLYVWWRSSRTLTDSQQRLQPDTSVTRKRLKRACGEGDATLAKQALSEWGALQWPADVPASLGEIASRCEGSLAQEIEKLNRCLYGRREIEWKDGPLLWRAFENQHAGRKVVRKIATYELEPLYKT
jgi:hypothetical protein